MAEVCDSLPRRPEHALDARRLDGILRAHATGQGTNVGKQRGRVAGEGVCCALR